MKTLHAIAGEIAARRERRRISLEKEGIFRFLVKPQGFVLIIVLLVSAMLITISGEFLLNAQTDISYMSHFKEDQQALELARTGIAISVFILEMDKSGKAGSILPSVNTNASIDTYKDIWAIEFPSIPIEGGSVKTTIRDEQAKINLSVIVNESGQSRFYPITKRVMDGMGFLPEILDCITDWIDPNSTRSSYGAETFDYYSTLPRPYSAKNGPLDSIDELLMIKGITPQIYYGLGGGNMKLERDLVPDNMFIRQMSLDQEQNQSGSAIDFATIKTGKEKSRALSDYFRAYGSKEPNAGPNKINLNTASYRVLSALTEEMTDAKVTELIRRRTERPFATTDEALTIIKDDTLKDYVSVSSSVFSIKATGTFHGQSVTVAAVYNRGDKRYYYYGIQ